MAMAMTSEERQSLRHECMVKYRRSKYWRLVNYNRDISFKFVSIEVLYHHHVRSVCANPHAPKFDNITWVGEAAQRHRRRPPPPGYGIVDRVFEIVSCLMPPPPPPPKIEEDESRDDQCSPEVVVVEVKEDDKYDLLWKKELLDELLAYDILSIDVATVLHSKGCLFSFLGHLFMSYKHPPIRAKAADLITTMVQSNRNNQKLLLEGKVLQLLLHTFNSYLDDATSRIKILVAISALFEDNEDVVIAFGREKGYAALREALISESVKSPMSALYQKVLDVITCLLLETNMYIQARNMDLDMDLYLGLEFADPSEVQELALISLLLLEGNEGGNSCQLVNDYIKLKKQVQSRRHSRSSMMINRSKPCFRISHMLLFKNKTYHCSRKAKINNSRSKTMKVCSKKAKKPFKLEKNEAPLIL